MNYAEISSKAMSSIYEARHNLNTSPLEPALRAIIELRVSQINNCFHCCRSHLEEARKNNVAQGILDFLPIWQQAKHLFTTKEILALTWCEYITHGEFAKLEETKAEIQIHFSEKEICDLVICISVMNALNRIAVSLKNF